jgi:hypothetical protein
MAVFVEEVEMLRSRARWSVMGVAALAVAALAITAAAGAARGRSAASEPAQAGAQGPVVVELFTSQGCSSCPPADRLLSRLKRDPKLAGAVIPLAFHVDYWNHLGWSDPFSSSRWSQRQTDYAHAFRSNRVYTPQAVVNGRSECVGSEESQVMRRIREALAAAPAGVVSLAAPVVTAAPGAMATSAAPGAGGAAGARVTVTARLLRPVPGPGVDVWVALAESGLTTAVGAGENASATLRNDQVVRLLVKAFTLQSPAAAAGTAGAARADAAPATTGDAGIGGAARAEGAPATAGVAGAAGDGRTAEVSLPLDARWNRAALDVVAFLQDPRSLTIYGAASRPLAAR